MAGDLKPRGMQSTNGRSGLPDPSSSSLLMSNLPSGHLSSEAFDTISQLRKELTEKGSGAFSRNAEDVKNAQALIVVALKVAFEVTAVEKQEPNDETEWRILECLDLIQLLIGSLRTLDGEGTETDTTGANTPVPFHLWLIVELIDFASNSRIDAVAAKIKDILTMIAHAQHDMLRSPICPRNFISAIFTSIVAGR